MEVEKIKYAFKFSDAIVLENRLNFKELMSLLSSFTKVYELEKSRLPYHINLIDELHADENAHSRILAKLLRYKENDTYPFLERFLIDLCDFDLKIVKPKIEKVDSCGRIDIPIFDKKYVVVIENKVTDKAIDQNTDRGGQLARYIETIHENYSRPLKEIFVVYTPRTSREPQSQCWVGKNGHSYKDEFSSRYCSLSYREKIYPWLKNEILPSISNKDLYLRSAIEQYIDYLEGVFSLRKINKEMNMNLQEFIKKEIGLFDKQPEEAIKILSDKKVELENAITQIDLLRTEYNKQIMIEQFTKWKFMLKNEQTGLVIVEDNFERDNNCINLGVEFSIEKMKFVAMIEVNDVNKPTIYLGISRHFVTNSKHSIPPMLANVIENQKLDKSDNLWYGWKYTSVKNGYERLQSLINEILTLKR